MENTILTGLSMGSIYGMHSLNTKINNINQNISKIKDSYIYSPNELKSEFSQKKEPE